MTSPQQQLVPPSLNTLSEAIGENKDVAAVMLIIVEEGPQRSKQHGQITTNFLTTMTT